MISIIISTYNRSNLLKKAIASVLAQSFKDIEIIVVDDCSTDDTEKVAKEFKVRYIKTEKNSGSDSKPKNLGISKANGEYIAFLDDDDTYRPDALKILYRYAKTGADITYGDYLIENNGKMERGWSLPFSASRLSQMNYIAMSVVLIKKDKLEEVGGFDESIHKFKDWNLWIRMQKYGCRFLHVPIIVTEVHPQKDSISNKYETKQENGMFVPTFNPADCLINNKELKVAIYTMTMNRLDYTKQMRKSLDLAEYPFDWFVVDQESTDGTREWLGTQKVKNILLNSKNEGLEKGWSQCIDLIQATNLKYDILIKVDNDAEMMTKGWLKDMVEIFKRNRQVILSPYVEGLEDSPGGVLRQRESGESPYVTINDKVLGAVPYLGGICFATPKALFDNFRFPEKVAGNKDYYLSQYAKSQGFALFYMEELKIWHIDGTQGQKLKYPDYK
jgi:GT2 family glycosyltransferase